jgi:hypothetical protein
MFACLDLKFHRELKLLSYLKDLLEKLYQTFFYSLKNSFEKIKFQNTILYLFKPMQAYLQRKYLQNVLC